MIGVNTAYIDGFSGGTLGVSVRALKPLIDTAKATQDFKPQPNNAPISAASTGRPSAGGGTTTDSHQSPKTGSNQKFRGAADPKF